LIEVGVLLVRLDHDRSGHDDQAVALAMITAHVLDRPSGRISIEMPDARLHGACSDTHAPASRPAPCVVVGRRRDAQYWSGATRRLRFPLERAQFYTPPETSVSRGLSLRHSGVLSLSSVAPSEGLSGTTLSSMFWLTERRGYKAQRKEERPHRGHLLPKTVARNWSGSNPGNVPPNRW